MAYDDDYVHEAGRTSEQRRRRRARLTMALVFVLLFGTFLTALAFTQGWVTDRNPLANPTAVCVPWTEPPPPRDITVNVYNATSKRGLAVKVSQTLAGQRFRIGTISNDPLRKQVDGVAEIRYGKKTLAQARVLALRFPGATLVADNRTNGILDVVLGDKFTKVANPKDPVRPTNAC